MKLIEALIYGDIFKRSIEVPHCNSCLAYKNCNAYGITCKDQNSEILDSKYNKSIMKEFENSLSNKMFIEFDYDVKARSNREFIDKQSIETKSLILTCNMDACDFCIEQNCENDDVDFADCQQHFHEELNAEQTLRLRETMILNDNRLGGVSICQTDK